MKELNYILSKLEENTNAILNRNKELEEEIKTLKGEEIEVPKEPIINTDCGLLGTLENLVFTIGNGATYSINDGQLIINGSSRYANICTVYKEKEEDCIPNVLGQYVLHIEGKIIKGCSNAYLNTTSLPLDGETFAYDYQLASSWQRSMRINIFLNNSTGEPSQMIITSLKLSKVE